MSSVWVCRFTCQAFGLLVRFACQAFGFLGSHAVRYTLLLPSPTIELLGSEVAGLLFRLDCSDLDLLGYTVKCFECYMRSTNAAR